MWCSFSARSMPGVRRQAANAALAAVTARSTSGAAARGAVSSTSSVAGLFTSKTRPSAAATHSFAIHICAIRPPGPDL